jgi:hypothetical protein
LRKTNGLELADTPQTALVVSIARRSRFLSRTNEAATGLEMRMLKTPSRGSSSTCAPCRPNFRESNAGHWATRFQPTSTASFFGQPSAPRQRRLPSSRARCSAESIQTTHYRFEWNGVRIDRLYAFDEEGTVLHAEIFAGKEEVLAA